ncbi:MAG: radical SAM protein [Bacteroidales bacterium]
MRYNRRGNTTGSSRRLFLRRLLGAAFAALPFSSVFALTAGRKLGSSPDIKINSPNLANNSNNMNESTFEPGYLSLHRSGELKRRVEILWNIMEVCELCPRQCQNRRTEGQEGDCGATSQLVISSFHPHFGEEQPLVMNGGSGTIFLSHCSMRCVFCINHEISILGQGNDRSVEDMADMMLKLQEIGCENINVVTPTHYTPHIVLALDKAAEKGLKLPLVYNTSGYEKTETLRLLDGVVDIYLPDFKYYDGAMAAKYSNGARDYPERAKSALLEMHNQVGVASSSDDGKIYSGLMIRHLVMPDDVSGTKNVLEWIANNLPKETYINLMSQYTPHYKADDYPRISRRITYREYNDAIDHGKKLGLTNMEIQG